MRNEIAARIVKKSASKIYLQHPVGSIYQEGYGTIPKMVIRDKNIGVYAKLIYAYFCSCAGASNTTYPNSATICADLCISRSTFFAHLKKLEEAGYLKHTKVISADNKFANNVYEIVYIIKR